MNKINLARLKELCTKIWYQLTLEERENFYYGEGTIGFVSTVCDILFYNPDDLTEESWDEILDELGEPDADEQEDD